MTILKEKIFRVGENRGKKRIWIEGKFLSDVNLNRGFRFDKEIFQDDGEQPKPYLRLTENENGQHMIAGTEQRPIIDLNGKYLNNVFEGFSHYKARIILAASYEGIFKTHIIIEGCKNE